ncbi:MAG TPA: calcium-binding protein [Planctomycetota bacterium]|nr:calcium-binding protein [Planctomycetota bacterium]
MRSSAIIFALVSLGLLATFGGMSGCKKSVNQTQPVIQNTVRISLSSTGTEGNLDCVADSIGISNDGRFVAFTSKASNMIPGGTGIFSNVFLRDNVNRTLTLVSVSNTGGLANGASGTPSMSGDGRYIAFSSFATNLDSTSVSVPAGVRQIYVRDMQMGTTTLVSRSSNAGLVADQNCNNPKISNNGNFVVFESLSNLLDGVVAGGDDNDAFADIYVRDWLNVGGGFPTTLVSMVSGAAPGSGPSNKGNGDSTNACISADGSVIAFASTASNLVVFSQDGGLDTNGVPDVFVREMGTNRTVRCSVEFAGSDPTLKGLSRSPTISLDGQMVSFSSLAGNLHPAAQEQTPNIYFRFWNGLTPFTEVLSVHTSGATGGASCDHPSISGDGTKIAWQSASSALVNGDTNGVEDIFLRNRTTLTTSRESVQTFGGQLDGQSAAPAYSADGRYIAFWSQATNAVDDDTNGAADIFLRGPPFK